MLQISAAAGRKYENRLTKTFQKQLCCDAPTNIAQNQRLF
jgi:hypothetical protein